MKPFQYLSFVKVRNSPISSFVKTFSLVHFAKLNKFSVRSFNFSIYNNINKSIQKKGSFKLPLTPPSITKYHLINRFLSNGAHNKGGNTHEIARELQIVAFNYLNSGNYLQAKPLFEKSLAIFKQLYGPQHLEIARTLHNLAMVYEKSKDYAKAKTLYEQGLAILEKNYSTHDMDIAFFLDSFGNFYREIGESAMAIPLFKRAIVLLEKSPGSDPAQLGHILNNLGITYSLLGEHLAAKAAYERALPLLIKGHKDNSLFLIGILTNYASNCVYTGDHVKAINLFEQALNIAKSFGNKFPETVPLNNIATTYMGMNDNARVQLIKEFAENIGNDTFTAIQAPEDQIAEKSTYGNRNNKI